MEWHSGPLNCYILCSCLRRIGEGFAQILPICVGQQVFRLERAAGFAAQAHAQGVAHGLPDRTGLAQVPDRGATPRGEGLLLFGQEAVEVCK